MTAVKIALAFVLSATAFAAAASSHITAQDKWTGKWRRAAPLVPPPRIEITNVTVSAADTEGVRTFDIWGRCRRPSIVASGAYVECKWGTLRTKFEVPARLVSPIVHGATVVPCTNIEIVFSREYHANGAILYKIPSAECQPPHNVPGNSLSYGMRRVPDIGLPPPDVSPGG
jgi:hypothetical protein